MKKYLNQIVQIGVLFLAGVICMLPEAANAGTCSAMSGLDTYICEPAIDPAPSGCTPINGKMVCKSMPSGYTNPANIATLVSFKAPQKLIAGVTSNITWETKYAAGCSIGSTPVQPSGSMSITMPATGTTYTLSCQDTDAIGSPVGTPHAVGSVSIAVTSQAEACPNGNLIMTGTGLDAHEVCVPNQRTTTQQSPTTDGTIKYAPLEPLPGLQDASNVSFVTMLNLLFKVLISVGALFAVGTLVWGGIMYMVSDVFETKSEARRRMNAAIYGLLILAGSWLILNTINPQLLIFKLNVPSSGNSSPNTSSAAGPAADKGERDDCENSLPAGGHLERQSDNTFKCIH